MIDYESTRLAFLFQLLEAGGKNDSGIFDAMDRVVVNDEDAAVFLSVLKDSYVLSKSNGEILTNPFFKLTLNALSLFKENLEQEKKDQMAVELFGVLRGYSDNFRAIIQGKIREEKGEFLEESLNSAAKKLSLVFGRELNPVEKNELKGLILETLVRGELYNDMEYQTLVILSGLETATYLMQRTGKDFDRISGSDLIENTLDISRTFRTIYNYAGREDFPGTELGAFESLYPYIAAFNNESLPPEDLLPLFRKSQLDTATGKDPTFNLLAHYVYSQDQTERERAVSIA